MQKIKHPVTGEIHEVPDWAKWQAVDEDGDLVVSRKRPVAAHRGHTWWSRGAGATVVAVGPYCPNWRNTCKRIEPIGESEMEEKFWLVWNETRGEVVSGKKETFERASKVAERDALSCPSNIYIVLEAVERVECQKPVTHTKL